jgi:RsiW-degrading membrane proteinase PrsW (M82 family)
MLRREILRSPVFLFLGLVAIVPPGIQLLETNTGVLYGLAIWSGVLWALLLYRLFADRGLGFAWALATLLFTTFIAFPMLELYLWLPPHMTGWFLRSEQLALRLTGFSMGVGAREELFKSVPLVALAVLTGKMRNPVNGLVLGMMSGVGFAVAENVYYVFQTLDNALAAVQQTGSLGYLVVPVYNNVVRMAMTPFLHGCFTGIFGYFVARAAADRPRRLALFIWGLGIAAALHGLYDTLVPVSPLFGLLVEAVSFFLLMTYALEARGLVSARQLGGGLFNRRRLARAQVFHGPAWQLRVLAGAAHGRTFALDGVPVFLGRDARCHVHLPEPTISRRHASLSPEGASRWRLRCLSLGLPLFLNGAEIEEALVRPGDQVQVGSSVLVVEPRLGDEY